MAQYFDQPNKNCLVWSARKKHADIQIHGQTINRQAITNEDEDGFFSVCCLANTIMKDTSDQPYLWTLQIGKLRRCMYVGICQIRQAESHRFDMWDWYQIGHGHYCLGSFGFVFSHSGAELNKKWRSFDYKEGDVLEFEYNPKQRKLKAVKKNNQWSMQVQSGKGQTYAICAYLWDYGDSISLINS